MIQIVKKSLDYIENHLTEKINIEDISKEVNCSTRTLQRLFKTICDYNISEYILKRKLSLIAKELKDTELSILDIAIKYGYQNVESLSRIFTKRFFITPSKYRKKQSNVANFEKIETSSMYDIDKYRLIDYYNEKKEEIILYGIKENHIDNETGIMYENGEKFYQILNKNKMSINKVYEICYQNMQETIVSKSILIEDNIEKLSKKIKKISIPATNWFVCIGRSKVSYKEAKILTMRLMIYKICNELYKDYGYYQDLEFAEKNEILNINIDKGFDKETQEYCCEIWMPIKEDFFIETNCKTCAECIVCETYSKKNIEQLLEKFPKGCQEFKYSLDNYILNEEIRKKKYNEIFKDRELCKLICL